MSANLTAEDPRCLVREAGWWRLISLLFERPRPGWRKEVAALASEVASGELAAAAEAADSAEEGAYLAVIGPGGRVSPREVAYRPTADPGWLLADIKGFYTAFGFQPRSEEPIDHVAVQTGFLGFLALKLAYARYSENADWADVVEGGARAFLADHLVHWAESLAGRLASAEPPDYFVRAGAVLASRVGPAPNPSRPVVPATLQDHEEFSCGRCPADPGD